MPDQIRVTAQARCSPAQLWHTLVDNRAAWWPELDFTASPGAPLTERAADGGAQQATGTVLAVARGRLLSFRWTKPGWSGHTVVSFQLDSAPGPDDDDALDRAEAPGSSAGWQGSTGVDYTDVVVTESGLGTIAAGGDVAAAHTGDWADHLADLIKLAEDASGT
ncbi:SRPBCC domain-containing protein [Arthrobacter sp. zg-ZUI100]|uniref:SRPBCC family protein n=1 Tax=Arthrobacter jiangjiafuii TaxID=2817475 RepID=UPI001AED5A65|nr:SRPBCC domain-containing protein [Arthrobacter jiangjiafuii]MBP3037073.1 SRPBCC domain-containing protein [Arthrobacter jiangjiafuii]